MEELSVPRITLVSGACCMPGLAALDKELQRNVAQAMAEVAPDVGVRSVSLSAVLNDPHSLNVQQRTQLLALFQKYGAKLAPAVLIGDRVRFAGSVPTVDQLEAALGEDS